MRHATATASSTRTVSGSQEQVWGLISDPHRLPRWWPEVERSELRSEDRWTLVFRAGRGRTVNVDYHLLESDPPWHRAWEQEVEGTPFERVLEESVTEFHLQPAGEGATEVTLSQRQKLRRYSRTGSFLLRREATRKLDHILSGLAEICG